MSKPLTKEQLAQYVASVQRFDARYWQQAAAQYREALAVVERVKQRINNADPHFTQDGEPMDQEAVIMLEMEALLSPQDEGEKLMEEVKP